MWFGNLSMEHLTCTLDPWNVTCRRQDSALNLRLFRTKCWSYKPVIFRQWCLNDGAKAQVTGHRSGHRLQVTGHRSQVTGQVTGHRSQATDQVTGHKKQ